MNQSAFTQKMLENLEKKDYKSVKMLMDYRIKLVKKIYQKQAYQATKRQI